MDYTVILTLIAFCLSVYAISSDIQRRNFVYKFSNLDIVLLSFFFLFLLVFLIVEDFYSFSEGNEYLSFKYSLLGFISLLTFIIYFSLLFFIKKIRRKKGFINFLNKLLISGKYDEILKNLEIYFDFLLKDYLEQKTSKCDNNGSGTDIFLETLLKDEIFISLVSSKTPDFGIRIIDKFRNDLKTLVAKFDFSYLFFKLLMKNKGSIIYRQLEENQNISDNRYCIPEDNYLLYAIFKEIDFVKDLRIYGSIGDSVLEYLHKRKECEVDSDKSLPFDYQKERWESPVFIGIRFFDIMILESLANDMPWHMWLYYFKSFTEKICKNIKYDENAYSEDYNFINMYEYYLTEIFESYIGWVNTIYPSHIALDNHRGYGIPLERIDSTHQNNNIIKSTLIAMFQSLEIIARSENLRGRYKRVLFNLVLVLYFKFIIIKKVMIASYGKVMKCLLESQRSRDFYLILKETLDNFDIGSLSPDGIEELKKLNKFTQERLNT